MHDMTTHTRKVDKKLRLTEQNKQSYQKQLYSAKYLI
jgi:hypothetical protein